MFLLLSCPKFEQKHSVSSWHLLTCQFSLELEDMYLFLSSFPWGTVKLIWAWFLPVGFQSLLHCSSEAIVMKWYTAPSAFSPCVVGQYHLIKFGLIVLAFYPAVATSRNTVKPGGNLRRASKWQTWKCMQVLYQSVLILLKKGGNSLGAGRQLSCSVRTLKLPSYLWHSCLLWHSGSRGAELCSRVNRVWVNWSSENLPGTRSGGCACCHPFLGVHMFPQQCLCLWTHLYLPTDTRGSMCVCVHSTASTACVLLCGCRALAAELSTGALPWAPTAWVAGIDQNQNRRDLGLCVMFVLLPKPAGSPAWS